jgi:rhamnulokinase
MTSPSSPIHCAAIDLGATSGRVIVGSLRGRELELSEAYRFPNSFNSLRNHHYWNVGGLLEHIVEGLRKAKTAFPSLQTCGIDTWGVDHALLDAKGRLVFPVHAYRDERTNQLHGSLVGTEDDRLLYQWTGVDSKTFHTAFQLAEVLKNYPGISDVVKQCLFLSDYLNFLLTGVASTEISIASTSQLLDIKSGQWSRQTLDYFGIPTHWFKKPVHAGRILGPLESAGLESIELVQTPGHDTSCAFEAIPLENKGRNTLILSTGTWFLLGLHTDRAILTERAQDEGYSHERTGQGTLRPNFGLLGLWLVEQVLRDFRKRPSSASDWAALVEAAEELPAARDLLNIKDKRLFSPTSMKTAIDEQLKEKGAALPESLPGYFRLICDSLAAGTRDAVRTMEELNAQTFDSIAVMGGGSKNRLLCQRLADFTGKTITAYDLEGAATGNLGYQFLALGGVSSLDEFRDLLRPQLNPRIFRPKPN